VNRFSSHGVAPSRPADVIEIAGVALALDPAGALWWSEEKLLVVADLHLEKGSSLARRGMLLPPYDTAATLERLARLIAAYAPRIVIALGDSFHDGAGADRLAPRDRAALAALQEQREWIWITGNHDPDPARGVAGLFADHLAIGPLAFRHQPAPQTHAGDLAGHLHPTAGGLAGRPHDMSGEIGGHLHPAARVRTSARAIRRRCFVADARRLVMPAFGAYAGGLNVRDAAFAGLFGPSGFTAHLLGDGRVHAFAAMHCLPE
jgi:DNA ligase-associated metallophosphoesterase